MGGATRRALFWVITSSADASCCRGADTASRPGSAGHSRGTPQRAPQPLLPLGAPVLHGYTQWQECQEQSKQVKGRGSMGEEWEGSWSGGGERGRGQEGGGPTSASTGPLERVEAHAGLPIHWPVHGRQERRHGLHGGPRLGPSCHGVRAGKHVARGNGRCSMSDNERHHRPQPGLPRADPPPKLGERGEPSSRTILRRQARAWTASAGRAHTYRDQPRR